MKRIISVLLSCLLIITSFACAPFYALADEVKPNIEFQLTNYLSASKFGFSDSSTIRTGKDMISAKKGEIVTLSLMLINTNRAMGVELYMDYNKDYLTPVICTRNGFIEVTGKNTSNSVVQDISSINDGWIDGMSFVSNTQTENKIYTAIVTNDFNAKDIVPSTFANNYKTSGMVLIFYGFRVEKDFDNIYDVVTSKDAAIVAIDYDVDEKAVFGCGHYFSGNQQYCAVCGTENPDYAALKPGGGTDPTPTPGDGDVGGSTDGGGSSGGDSTGGGFAGGGGGAPTSTPENDKLNVATKPEQKPNTSSVSNNITPTKITNKKGKKKALVVYWQKANGINGYEIQVATDKKFKKNAKTVVIIKQSTGKKTVKGLKKNKKYYIRVRTYKITNTKKQYSSWSKVKSVKTK